MNKADRIRRLRIKRGITQSELADRLNTTKQTISKYEKGIVTNIPSDRIEALAMILETTPEYLLGWDQVVEEIKEPAMFDGLTENQKKLMQFVQSVPEDKAALALRLIQSILEDD